MNSIKANLELVKNEYFTNQETNNTNPNLNKKQYLSVIVPEEFKDYAYIQIRIVKSKILILKQNI